MTCRTLISMHRLMATLGQEDQQKASGQLEQLAARSPGWTRPPRPGAWSACC
jgi:hypothetical protein